MTRVDVDGLRLEQLGILEDADGRENDCAWRTCIANAAGFKVGDRIVSLKGQPILSTADIQWVLHNAAVL
ncbi:MAG: hypothetical protein O7F08_05160 [Deltaproteobacteria bacterium]|nr:hypothetical protein [Deltaproteobacteria bacterium]